MRRQALFKYIWRLSLPVLLTNLLQTSVTVIDTFMVGRLGPLAIAAVGMGNTIRLMLLIAVLSVSGGAMSLVAQAKGARDPHRISFVARQAIVSGIILSIALALIGFLFSRPLLSFMENGGEEEVIALGMQYLIVIFIGTPFLVLNIIMDRLMQGAGDTLTPFLLTVVMVFLNILFNYLFIFGVGSIPAFGVVGAAIGTVLARMVVVILAFLIIRSKRNVIKILPGSWWPNWQMVKDILSIGVPSGIQGLLRHSGGIISIGIVTATELGTYGAAILTIGWQVESLAAQPVVGLNVAATSLVGQALGKWQEEAAYHQGNIMIILGVIVMSIFITPMIIFAPEIIHLFDPSAHPTVMKGGTQYFRINTFFLPATAIAILITGALRGAGDTQPAMMSTLVGRNLLTVSLAWFLALFLKMGAIGVWYAMVIGRVTDCIFMLVVWRRKKWLNVALEKTDIFRVHLRKLSTKKQAQFLEEVRAVQMAVPKTIEIISETGVIYKTPQQVVQVRFIGDTYRVIGLPA